jgi:hypothetical protein
MIKTSWKNEWQIEAGCGLLCGISKQTKTALYEQDPETQTKTNAGHSTRRSKNGMETEQAETETEQAETETERSW